MQCKISSVPKVRDHAGPIGAFGTALTAVRLRFGRVNGRFRASGCVELTHGWDSQRRAHLEYRDDRLRNAVAGSACERSKILWGIQPLLASELAVQVWRNLKALADLSSPLRITKRRSSIHKRVSACHLRYSSV